ncbi:hypothetical protein ACMXYV_07975 [Neptuniibacter sp. SY11_33]|uniref:hypothetical protein n=1 Tax=Neptuniibacter sp. SY11_33 TaxID=3398215 RepID=UPI0039F4D01D
MPIFGFVNCKLLFRMSLMFAFSITLTACDDEPSPFLWEPNSQEASLLTKEEAELSLDSWLKKAPFDELWDPYANHDANTNIYTNVNVVFPFMDKWHNSFGKIDSYTAFKTKASVYYADPEWSGTVLVWAGLKNQKMPFYLKKSNTEKVSISTPGNNDFAKSLNGLQHSNVDFDTTRTFSETSIERQAVLWGSRIGADHFLTGFLERGNLVFLVAFPCNGEQVELCADKLGQVSSSLSLNVTAWENLTAEDLEKEEQDFFFNTKQHNVFERHEIFKDRGIFKPRIKVTMNGHPFRKNEGIDRHDKVVFDYQKATGDVRVIIHKPQEIPSEKLGDNTAEQYLQDLYSSKKRYRIDYEPDYKPRNYESGRIAYFDETIKDKVHSITAYTFLKQKHVLKIVYEFPVGDEQARITAERFITMIDLPYFFDDE